MKCPLSFGYFKYNEDDKGVQYQACLEHECQWWSDVYGACAVWGMAHHLERLADILEAINLNLAEKVKG
jgi:hypothetical protein